MKMVLGYRGKQFLYFVCHASCFVIGTSVIKFDYFILFLRFVLSHHSYHGRKRRYNDKYTKSVWISGIGCNDFGYVTLMLDS